MENDSNEPQAENLPASPPSTALDAHGFDPAEYEWLPVLRRPRKDGWTIQRQRDFIAALADSGCVEHAARDIQMSVMSCYRLRRAPGAENFAAAWDAALAQAARMLVDLAFDRAINGSEEPVFDRDGKRVGRRMRHNDRMMMFLLRAYMPDRFRDAHRSMILVGDEASVSLPPVGEAILRLEPEQPAEPHLLMAPDDLQDAIDMAHILPGELPTRHHGHGDRETIAGDAGDEEAARAEIGRLIDAELGRGPSPSDP